MQNLKAIPNSKYQDMIMANFFLLGIARWSLYQTKITKDFL